MHVKLEARLMQARGQMKKKTARTTLVKVDAVQAASYIYNYNTVEATLLCCAVFVCLSGIMFASGQSVCAPYAYCCPLWCFPIMLRHSAKPVCVVTKCIRMCIFRMAPHSTHMRNPYASQVP